LFWRNEELSIFNSDIKIYEDTATKLGDEYVATSLDYDHENHKANAYNQDTNINVIEVDTKPAGVYSVGAGGLSDKHRTVVSQGVQIRGRDHYYANSGGGSGANSPDQDGLSLVLYRVIVSVSSGYISVLHTTVPQPVETSSTSKSFSPTVADTLRVSLPLYSSTTVGSYSTTTTANSSQVLSLVGNMYDITTSWTLSRTRQLRTGMGMILST
jgi:hypothetical protein